MLVLTSPAKSLNQNNDWQNFSITPTLPVFLDNSSKLVNKLKSLDKKDLVALLGVSDKLVELNMGRYNSWSEKHTEQNSKPAILMFDGDVYKRIPAENYSKVQMNFMQKSLRIISSLYGLLRPYDLIQPYRLEMSTKLGVGVDNNLYEFWGDTLTEQLNQEAKSDKHELVVNLASQEYSKAINFNKLECDLVEVEFLQKRDGKLKNIGIFSKAARGMMIDFIVKNQLSDLESLKAFSTEDYKFQNFSNNTLTFVR